MGEIRVFLSSGFFLHMYGCVCPQSSHLSPPAMKNGTRPYPVVFALLSHIGKEGCISSARRSCRQGWEVTSPPRTSSGRCPSPQLSLASGLQISKDPFTCPQSSMGQMCDRRHFHGSQVSIDLWVLGSISQLYMGAHAWHPTACLI